MIFLPHKIGSAEYLGMSDESRHKKFGGILYV